MEVAVNFHLGGISLPFPTTPIGFTLHELLLPIASGMMWKIDRRLHWEMLVLLP